MTSFGQKKRLIRSCALAITMTVMFETGTLPSRLSAQEKTSPTISFFRRMADGKQWMTRNLNVGIAGSYCYEGAEGNCGQYGRLYTWESAVRVCRSLGDGWRLPTDHDWRVLAKHYGGVSADSEDKGKAAYEALLAGGGSGFDAVLGGGRSDEGQYARLEAHGFYWTATEIDSNSAWFYNFGKGGQAFYRQDGGGKASAFSVRCVTE